MKYLLDTNVYLDAVRSEERRNQFRRAFVPLLPATYLSAVVAYELLVNAADQKTRAQVFEFIRPLERAGRLVTPTFADWTDVRRGFDRDSRPRLEIEAAAAAE